MPNKTPGYYARTIRLKLASRIYSILDSTGFLKGYKEQKQDYFQYLFKRDFSESLVNKNHTFSKLFITYCHFDHPDGLGQHLHFDQNGIAMGRADTPAFYNFFFTAYFALVCYNHYIRSGSTESLNKFILQAEFLASQGVENQKGFWFFYEIEDKKFGLKPPWTSALTQSAALSVFIRAHEFNKDKYQCLAEKVFKTLQVPVGKGGVLRKLDNGHYWLEERPSVQPDLTLNGFVFSLVTYYEYYHFSGRQKATAESLKELVATLFELMNLFVRGKYTKYRIRSKAFHNVEYQGFYVCLFLHLFHLSGKPSFLEMARHFDCHINWKYFYEFYGLEDQSHKLVKPFFYEN